MENVTFNNPKEYSNVFLSSDGRPAKLNQYTKRPNLVKNYLYELNKVKDINFSVNTNNLIMNTNTSMDMVNYPKLAVKLVDNVTGKDVSAKKLKVKEPVAYNKISPKYQDYLTSNSLANKMPVDFKAEPVIDNKVDEVNMPNVEVHNNFAEVPNTRMSRLERTGEIPTVHENNNYYQENNVINTPDRFAVKEEVKETNPFPTRTSRNQDLNFKDEEQIKIGNEAETLNRISNLVHGTDDASDLSVKINDAHRELSKVEKQSQEISMVNANLENQIKEVRETVEKLKRVKAEKQESELNNTLNMIETIKQDNFEKTEVIKNLKEELADLMKQYNEMKEYDNESSYRRAA